MNTRSKAPDGRKNLCGAKVAAFRTALVPRCSQRALADKLQLQGLDVSKNTIQCIESGARTVTDIELKALAAIFGVTTDELLND